jgi:vanillate O-demethylase ferredoxin subunit
MAESTAWIESEVVDTQDVAPGIRRLVVRVDGDHDYSAPGCHVDVRIGTGYQVTRSYSVVAFDRAKRDLVLGVQLADPSRGGSAFMHSLSPGSRLQISAPVQGFPLGYEAPSYLLLAGGIGITALIAMADRLRERGADYRLVYVARTADRLAFAAQLDRTHGSRLAMWSTDTTPLDLDALIEAAHPQAEMYVCGPVSLLEATRARWAAAGRRPSRLRFETFGSGRGPGSEPFHVLVPRLSVEAEVRRDESMLDALSRAGVEVMYDCLRGECGLCIAEVLGVDGRIDHRDVFFDREQKIRGDRMCMCVSRVLPAHGTGPTPAVTVDLP